MFSQDLHDASEHKLNSTNLFAVTTYHHSTPTIIATLQALANAHLEVDEDENLADKKMPTKTTPTIIATLQAGANAHLALAVSCIMISLT